MCVRHHAKFRCDRSNVAEILRLFDFFKHCCRPICNACVGTTLESHFVVFITVQNLVGIDAVVLIICTLFDFASLD